MKITIEFASFSSKVQGQLITTTKRGYDVVVANNQYGSTNLVLVKGNAYGDQAEAFIHGTNAVIEFLAFSKDKKAIAKIVNFYLN